MTTETDICNMALTQVGAGTIDSYNDENTKAATTCRLWYPIARDEVLEEFPWRFAKTTKALALTDEDPKEWSYSYTYPNDCLKVHYVIPTFDNEDQFNDLRSEFRDYTLNEVAYEVGYGTDSSPRILCNTEDAFIAYTKRVTSTALFNPMFITMLSWKLASYLAEPMGGDNNQRHRAYAEAKYQQESQKAMAKAANEANKGVQRLPNSLKVAHSRSALDTRVGSTFWR